MPYSDEYEKVIKEDTMNAKVMQAIKLNKMQPQAQLLPNQPSKRELKCMVSNPKREK